MHFLILNLDRPDSLALRTSTRPAHLDYLHGAHAAITLKLAGPLLAPDGTTMIGSMLVVEAESRAEAGRFATDDPFTKAGLFVSSMIYGWNWTTGKPGI